MEKLEPFIPESCLKDAQPCTIVPVPRIVEEVARSTLTPRAPPFPQPNSECGATSKLINTDSASVLERAVANMNLIATGVSLPLLEVMKFSEDPCEFFKFKTRFHLMVESQNLSDEQKQRRLREFADCSRTLYETLKEMNALSEMNLSNLGKMCSKLPTVQQARWRDEVQRIRERGMLPSFKDLVEFIEKRADAVNDPIFGRIGETGRAANISAKRNSRVPPPSRTDGRVTTLATQLSLPGRNGPRGTGHPVKCINCGASHKLAECDKFKNMTVRQRRVFVGGRGLCFNCLRKGHFLSQCFAKSKCNLCPHKHHFLLHNAALDCVETPCQSQDQDEVTANTMIGDGRASSSGQNQDQVRVSANVITANGGDSETLTSSTVHFAKFSSYKTCSPTAFTSQNAALQVVPVRVEGENGNSVSTWALLDTGSKESFIAKSTADKLRLRVKNFESLAVCTLTRKSTVRVGRVDLTVLSMEGPEGHRIEIKDVKVVEHLHVNKSRPQNLTKLLNRGPDLTNSLLGVLLRFRQERIVLAADMKSMFLQRHGEVKEISLHQFSDASDEGYDMCPYLQFVYEDGSIQCSFLIGKSKAMPVRPISIPRLELQAATLTARIYQVCREELTYRIDRVVFWTDSQTTLQYIKNESKRFYTYVANRIAEIHEITSLDQWRHCPGKLNPADDASHGLKPQKLIDQYRWWKGPEYLWESEKNWPEAEIGEVLQNDPEVRNEVQVHSIKTESPDAGLDPEAPCTSDRPVYKMMTYSSSCFAEELRDLKANKKEKSSSRLVKLKPVLAEGVLRVGGRLEEAVVLSYNDKHPIILPKIHNVSQLIVRCCHERLAHAVSNSLATDSFLNAYRRFVGRRGPVRQLRSDQGTNFIGAMNELKQAVKELNHERIREELLITNCDWIEFKPNVPHASHFGGVWERQIRSVRNVLASLLESHGIQLDDESLRTFMVEAEAIVNCRPLTVNTINSSRSPEPLTPNHLLTMKSRVIMPPPGDFKRADLYLSKRWRRVQYLANEFWNRWRKEFLQSLQPRKKWIAVRRNLQVNDIVIVIDESLPRNRWKLARVHETFPNDDGLVRKVKMAIATECLDDSGRPTKPTAYLERPVQKVVLLLPCDRVADQGIPTEEPQL
ncbi:hypothetical protein AWC38_SpisGene20907 [Stylophora pistillata]|uniref:DUF5641 domain-containing protein n=2 Tax=Stylophora pistillata TaxID=50429 RepID=A0A2B4REW9_STYPI|nr:hypothetical protein AWC38_SpisGene20907 [Stylophora pistillata]